MDFGVGALVSCLRAIPDVWAAVDEYKSINETIKGFADEVHRSQAWLDAFQAHCQSSHTQPPQEISNAINLEYSHAKATCAQFNNILTDLRKPRSALSGLRQYWAMNGYGKKVQELRQSLQTATPKLASYVLLYGRSPPLVVQNIYQAVFIEMHGLQKKSNMVELSASLANLPPQSSANVRSLHPEKQARNERAIGSTERPIVTTKQHQKMLSPITSGQAPKTSSKNLTKVGEKNHHNQVVTSAKRTEHGSKGNNDGRSRRKPISKTPVDHPTSKNPAMPSSRPIPLNSTTASGNSKNQKSATSKPVVAPRPPPLPKVTTHHNTMHTATARSGHRPDKSTSVVQRSPDNLSLAMQRRITEVDELFKIKCFDRAHSLLKGIVAKCEAAPRSLPQGISIIDLRIRFGVALVHEGHDLKVAEKLLRDTLRSPELSHKQKALTAYILSCVLVNKNEITALNEAKELCKCAVTIKLSELEIYSSTHNLPAAKLAEILALQKNPQAKYWKSVLFEPFKIQVPMRGPTRIWSYRSDAQSGSYPHFVGDHEHVFGQVSTRKNGTSVILRDVHSGIQRGSIWSSRRQSTAAFAPDGRTFTTVGLEIPSPTEFELHVRIASVHSKQAKVMSKRIYSQTVGSERASPCVGYSGDSSKLAFGLKDLELIEVETGLRLATSIFGTIPSLKGYHLTQIAFSPDGKTIAISVKQSGKPSTVALLCAKSLSFIGIVSSDSKIYGCAFAPDSQLIAVQGSTEIALLTVATRALAVKRFTKTSLTEMQPPIFSLDGSQILHLEQGKVIFRQTKDLTVKRELVVEGEPCFLALSKDERFLAVSASDGLFQMFLLA